MTPVRAHTRASKARAGYHRRSVAAFVALLAALTGALSLVPAPAVAGPVDTNWVTSAGPAGTFTNLSDGSSTPAQMSYSMNPAGLGVIQSWDFTATATAPATAVDLIKVPYTWQGLHAFFQVTTRLDLIVNGVVVASPEIHGPTDCCTTPSNGFVYGGVATFDNLAPGDSYGFRLSGSNGDSNNFLQGTLTLSIQPFFDAAIGTDNRDWPGAENITDTPATGLIKEPGEARWFKFDIDPGQDVKAVLKGAGIDDLPADYDVALYGDIGKAFDQLVNGEDVARLAASSASTGVSGAQTPEFPVETSEIPTKEDPPSGLQFAPRVYAPRVYAPRVYAPRVYAPRVYAPRVYAPRVYAPGSYIPANVSDDSLSDAFSAAQNQVLLAASTNTGKLDEVVSASTGNSDGVFYLRVQGHDDSAFNDQVPFQVITTVSANPACAGLQTFPKDPGDAAPAVTSQAAVIVTDTNRLGLTANTAPWTAYLASLGQLASATDGVVVNVAGSAQVQSLWNQVQGHRGCPQAVNMVADAIKGIVDDWRNANSSYVVIAGGDDVIPFFRYQDTSGLGPESQFSPPLLPDTPAGASLLEDQVQGQDAYGSSTSVTIGGVTLPLPDLAVGRLVKTPAEISGTVANFLSLQGGALPEPDTSLVTGYDFLADAADAVNSEFRAALPAQGAVSDTLITHPGAEPAEQPWNRDQLRSALFDSHHDVVYLAGHFSANDTLAADFETTFDADELDPALNADKLKNTLVLSAGCHSGYSIVDSAGVPPGGTFPGTNTFDWTQRMAQQKAVLIGGTGYQYGDTDFLEYSERLYLDIARRLHEETGSDAPIAIGKALALAKQDYLAGLTTLSGIDQKAMLQATLYGLPMTGFDAPRRSALPTRTSNVTTTPVLAGTAGAANGLSTADVPMTTSNTPETKTVVAGGETFSLKWLDGADGVTIQPGAPAIPKQVTDVTVAGQVLRGIGFWSGDYADTNGVLPLTGAPAIEGSTPNSTFSSEVFFPQRLATANYFGALGGSGRTTLVVNPAQYRTFGDPDAAVPTNTVRNYSHLGMKLFYGPEDVTVPVGQPDPTLAAPPGISDVKATVTDGVVTFSARVSGDPVAGVQQVWVTWTGLQGGAGHGHWRSVDLSQDLADSTLWTGTLALPNGQPFNGVRFLVQAANGVGGVSAEVGQGDGHSVVRAGAVDTAGVNVRTNRPTGASPLGVSAHVSSATGVAVAGRDVHFTVLQGGAPLFDSTATTGSGGNAVLTLPPDTPTPTGLFTVVASIFGSDGLVSASDTALDVDTATVTFLPLTTPTTASPFGVTAVVKDASGAVWANREVRWSVTRAGQTVVPAYTATTDATGKVTATTDGEPLPSGALVVQAELLSLGGDIVRDTASATVTLIGIGIAVAPAAQSTPTGTAFASPISATLTDALGPVAGVRVTFTAPDGAPSATFPSGGKVATAVTNASGVATSPALTAGTTPGAFTMTVSAPGAVPVPVPMGVKYGLGPFVSPVSATTTTTSTGTTPVKISALLHSGAKLSDTAAAALVQSGLIQVRWREISPDESTVWLTSTKYTVGYDAKKDFFQADLKASSLGWTKGRTYRVEFRILMPSSTLQGTVDLGSRSFDIKVTK